MNVQKSSAARRLAIAAGLSLAIGGATVAWTQSAQAGHENVVLEAALDGRSEVGPSSKIAGDPDGRGEIYVFGIDGDPNTLCYVMTVSKIGPATAAHIHEARAGANGPVVVNLARPTDGNAADCLTEGEADKFLNGQTVAEILENPQNYYVNVHNQAYPSGALRGQLAVQR